MYKDPRQDLGRRNNSYTRYPRKCFTEIYGALYGDAMLELIRMSSTGKFLKWICADMQSGAFWDPILRNVSVVFYFIF